MPLLLLLACAPASDLAPATGCAAWDPAAEALEQDMAALVDAERALGGDCGGGELSPAAPLAAHEDLRCAARLHSQDMALRGFFDHVTPEGADVVDRVEAQGYAWRAAGENILQGEGRYDDAAEALDAWMQSPGHCRNILDAGFTELGVGVWLEGGQVTWTQVFGAR